MHITILSEKPSWRKVSAQTSPAAPKGEGRLGAAMRMERMKHYFTALPKSNSRCHLHGQPAGVDAPGKGRDPLSVEHDINPLGDSPVPTLMHTHQEHTRAALPTPAHRSQAWGAGGCSDPRTGLVREGSCSFSSAHSAPGGFTAEHRGHGTLPFPWLNYWLHAPL